jgi:hypothetical protein
METIRVEGAHSCWRWATTLALFAASAVAGFAPAADAGSPRVAVPPTVTAIGPLASGSGIGVSTLSVSPKNVGDLLTLAVKVDASDVDSSNVDVTSVLGGGVSLWTETEGPYNRNDDQDLELWIGTVTTTGPSVITVHLEGETTPVDTELTTQEFSSSLGSHTYWSVDIYADAGIHNVPSKNVTFPALTPHGSGELYFGYASGSSTGSAGSTPGFTYSVTPGGNIVTYDSNASAPVQPTADQEAAGASDAVASFILASSSIPSTVTGLSPRSGSDNGGTVVTIRGSHFTRASAVHFGTVGTTSFTVDSDTRITAITTDGSLGTTDVSVTTPVGTSAIKKRRDRYTYCVAGRQRCSPHRP